MSLKDWIQNNPLRLRRTIDLAIPQQVASPQSLPLFHQVTERIAGFQQHSKPSNTGAMPGKSRGFGGWPPRQKTNTT
ncbi:MAG: hypothetical protein ACKN9U_21030, partial [Pirellulaceae bacterium]